MVFLIIFEGLELDAMDKENTSNAVVSSIPSALHAHQQFAAVRKHVPVFVSKMSEQTLPLEVTPLIMFSSVRAAIR